MKFFTLILVILLSACSSTPEPVTTKKPVVVLKHKPKVALAPFKHPTSNQKTYLEVLEALNTPLNEEEIRQLYVWVEAEYNYFYQTNFVTASLVRGNRYIPYLQYRLKSAGLPVEYSYLAMIESAFRTVALSHKGAHGVWQLMPATAKELGITPHQRQDVVKATEAAIKYIKARESAFGDDSLLIAASYNAGEYGVSKRFAHVDSGRYNFVTIYPHLPKETRHYVPRWIAASMLAKQIKRQGKMPPPESVLITRKDYEIAPLAQALGMNKQQFDKFNPDFAGESFLSNQHNFIVHPNAHPVNAVDGFHISAATGFEPQYIAGNGQTIATYTTVAAARKAKEAEQARIAQKVKQAEQARQALLAKQAQQAKQIQLAKQAKAQQLKAQQAKQAQLAQAAKAKQQAKPAAASQSKSQVAQQTPARSGNYIKVAIKPGMTFTRLNRWFDVTQQELIALNPSLKQGLRAGSEIKVPASGIQVKQYKVQKGDSLGRIASTHRVELEDVRLMNQIKDNNIRVGQVLVLYMRQG